MWCRMSMHLRSSSSWSFYFRCCYFAPYYIDYPRFIVAVFINFLFLANEAQMKHACDRCVDLLPSNLFPAIKKKWKSDLMKSAISSCVVCTCTCTYCNAALLYCDRFYICGGAIHYRSHDAMRCCSALASGVTNTAPIDRQCTQNNAAHMIFTHGFWFSLFS